MTPLSKVYGDSYAWWKVADDGSDPFYWAVQDYNEGPNIRIRNSILTQME